VVENVAIAELTLLKISVVKKNKKTMSMKMKPSKIDLK
jgi:hypothetical protein